MTNSKSAKSITVAHASSRISLQEILAASLDFPGYYGKNWDAFWDCITRNQTSMPDDLTIKGFEILMERLPNDAKHLKECLTDFEKEHPNIKIKWELLNSST